MGLEKSPDVASASRLVQVQRNETIVKPFSREEVEQAAKKVSDLVQLSSLSHFEDCIAFWLISDYAKELVPGGSLVSANGPDELFCGYDRFRRILDSQGYAALDNEIKRALDVAHDLSLQVSSVAAHFGLGIVEPFLSQEFESTTMEIPVVHKILAGNDRLRKRVWRSLGRRLNLSEETVLRPKKAMQYGMGIHGVVSSMMKHGRLKIPIHQKP